MIRDVLATAIAVLFVCTVAVCAVGYMVVRRIGHSSLLRRARLAPQLLSPSKSRRELARLRASVLRARAGTRSIMVVVGERASNGGLVGLHDRLERLAVTVERQLEILSYEPDDAVLTASLAPLHQRAQKVIRAATEVREAASLLLEGTAELELDALAEEVRSEVEALKHGRDVLDRAASPI